MQYGKVEICGINTSELKVLGEKEKMDLLRKAQAGDKQARDALICGNLRLVLSVIQRFSGIPSVPYSSTMYLSVPPSVMFSN